MKILIQGQVQGIISKEFEGKITKRLQFLEDGKDGLKVVSVKMLENTDLSEIKKGSFVSLEVKITTYNNTIFYTQTSDIKIQK